MDNVQPQQAKASAFNRFLVWRSSHISDRQFLLLLSLIVGALTALAALVLKWTIEHFHTLVLHLIDNTESSWLYLIFPVMGILLSGLFIKYVVKDDIGHGVTKILYALSKRQGRIRAHNMWSSVVASAITIGLGGSVGAESPIVLTGSAIGSNIGSMFKMEHRTLMLLIGCGAAGAIAGIFKAPIAGVVFVLEVLMLDMSMSSLLPLLLSSVTSATVSYIFTGNDALFNYVDAVPFELARIPYVLLLGVVCGVISFYFSWTMNKLERGFALVKNYYAKFAIAAVCLSVLIYLFPELYGEGYDTIDNLLSAENLGAHLPVYFILIILFKVLASVATNSGGGCGGIFAPSLFMGCVVGFVFSKAVMWINPGIVIPVENFALFGMAGLMSGVMHAPLTGIFLIAELTGGYSMFLPLMMVSIISYLTIRLFQPHSIYSMRLARKGELMTHHKDQAVLLFMSMDKVLERDLQVVQPDMELGHLVNIMSQSNRNIFPVLNLNNHLVGVISIEKVRKVIFRPELYTRFTVQDFMIDPPARLSVNDPMEVVMEKFDKTKAWNLPVENENGVYVGYISKSKMLSVYRDLLLEFSEE
ncbi:MAG: chloride channel protein [Bacteroidaceae bacterium]|nr:chloride channel protein [Bacteroidaceae bacterium]